MFVIFVSFIFAADAALAWLDQFDGGGDLLGGGGREEERERKGKSVREIKNYEVIGPQIMLIIFFFH